MVIGSVVVGGIVVGRIVVGRIVVETVVGKVVEETMMIKSMHVSKITEGEWIRKEVKVKGKVICGPKDKLGVSTKQIAELKKHKIKTVTVKQGIPFIPGFLLGYLVIMLVGNWINILFFL